MKIPKLFVPEKNLEEKTKELEKEKTKQDLIEKLIELNPKRNVLFTAVEELKAKEDITKFYQQYIEYLRINGEPKEVKENPKKTADSNIGYVLGYYSQEKAAKWHSVLEDICHPIFGKPTKKASAAAMPKEVQNYLSSPYKEKYGLSEYGIWEIMGEDPNCDLGGYHHSPYLETCEGYFIDVLTYAVKLDGFYSWGSGGAVKKIDPAAPKKIGAGGKRR